jgi:hypothetical protein
LAALYFACGGDVSSDGELFLFDAYGLSSNGIMTSRHPKFAPIIDAIVQWKKAADLPRSIIAVRPDHFDRRIALQRSCFTFHVPNQLVLTPTSNNRITSFTISGAKKKPIQKELSLLGIDHFSVYGDLEHLVRYLTDAYM